MRRWLLGALALACLPARAGPIPVRFAEGLTRGYMLLRDTNGKILANGDLLQVAKDDVIEKRMTFRFKDGSLYDERVTYTENGHFRLGRYELTQRGPAFADDLEISLTAATGAYTVKKKDRKDGDVDTDEGKLEDLPDDVYNGLLMTIVKDLPKGGAKVHFVTFSPSARVIELELLPAGEHKISVGDLTATAQHILIKPNLGFLLKVAAKITGRDPEDLHAWVATGDVPAFVGFEGSFNTPGPTWRIEVVSPQLTR
ncbi:MAG TPA: hypothetical protein VJ826_07370 [Candidatus Polarisedimenticolaceae bacterium]|nr:hypothetical protein [Candidatus Polarisedimenticolaceae bacterium]